MTEELITQLASIDPERLRVIARTSAMHYKQKCKDTAQISHELNLDYVVEGSIRRAGDRLRISVQLIRSRDQTHLWAESYNGDAHDLLAFESEVSQAIARQIELAVPLAGGRRPWRRETVNAEAYSDFIMGLCHLHKYNPAALHKAIAYFQAAVAKDAQYARAHAKLAHARVLAGFWGWTPGGSLMRDAEESACTALRLDEGNADAHEALGDVRWFYHWDFAAAEREFERAATLAPHDPVRSRALFSLLGAVKEDHRRAIAEAERALQLDPLSVLMRAEAGWVFYWARQLERAIAQCRHALELDPNYPTAHWIIGLSQLAKGCFDQAIVTFSNAVRLFDDHFSLAALGMAYGSEGRREEARQVHAELERRAQNQWVSEVYFAWPYIGMGELDQAFDWLDRACDRRNPHVLWLRVAAAYDPLRRAPRYPDLLARLGLPAAAEPKLPDTGNIAGL